MGSVELVELWRGPFRESVHRGHIVICGADGEIVEAWGDPDRITLPRSSSKMIQALPLLTSGAGRDLSAQQLALACASHQGAHIHTNPVQRWLADLGLSDADLRCGPQTPNDIPARDGLIKTDASPCQYHNNCSGKHTGFLMLAKHLGAGPEYVDPDHPVQKAVLTAFEDICGENSPGYGIDGCSAPNYAVSLHGFARAMARFACADADSPEARLRHAMATFPELVAGEGRACTKLMRAMGGKVSIKTGAEGVFAAILPEQKLGVALKIEDGTTRASEAALTALMVRLGVLDARDSTAMEYLNAPITNWRGIETGHMRPAPALV